MTLRFASTIAAGFLAVLPAVAQAPALANVNTQLRAQETKDSQLMWWLHEVSDVYGPRLTGSPGLRAAQDFAVGQMVKWGFSNVHLEAWNFNHPGWQNWDLEANAVSPFQQPLNVRAVSWTPGTNGPVSGEAVYVNIQDDKDFDQYKGKLAGKVVLLGEMREVPPVDKALFERYSDKELEDIAEYPTGNAAGMGPDYQARLKAYMARYRMADKIAQFLADEKAAGVIRPSRDAKNGGGSGGTIFDDNGAALGRTPYKRETAVKVPVVVMAIESYGRVYRLLQAHVPVTIEMDVETKFTGDNEHGYDTIAEIPGTDPNLKEQIVMVGGHLDSWIAGTGATDNGAGTIVAMEVMRILKALDVRPRRTIRIALWSGEEEGLFGSRGYVKEHFGFAPPLTTPEQQALPEFMRATGPLELKPEQKLISGYFNVDNGSGKIRGIYLQENAAVEPIFAQWMAPLKDLGVTTITMRNTGGTDHLSFDAVGIPGFQFIQDPLDYESRTHHSNQDVFERLQPADLKQAAVVEAIFVYNTAMRDQMLPRKPLPHPELRQQQTKPLPGVFPGAVEPSAR